MKTGHLGTTGAAPDLRFEIGQLIRGPLPFGLDASIPQVPHPAADAGLLRDPAREVPEAHRLDPPRNAVPPPHRPLCSLRCSGVGPLLRQNPITAGSSDRKMMTITAMPKFSRTIGRLPKK